MYRKLHYIFALLVVFAIFLVTAGSVAAQVNVSFAGTGSGTVSGVWSSTGEAQDFPNGSAVGFSAGSSFTFTATPVAGSTFAGWSGGYCTGTGSCTVTEAVATVALIATFTSITTTTNTFVIQPGSEGKDTSYGTVYANNGTPDAESLYMGGWGDWYYDFLEFDLSGSPSAGNTLSATLHLCANTTVNDPGLKMYRITESWTESGVTLSNNPASVFYKNFGSFPSSSAVGVCNSVDITDLYKSWKNGTYSNYGIKLVPTSNSQTNGGIYSSDSTNSNYRPKLVITQHCPDRNLHRSVME